MGADLVVGSKHAARAYPGKVVAMIPAKNWENVLPPGLYMNPDRFAVYS